LGMDKFQSAVRFRHALHGLRRKLAQDFAQSNPEVTNPQFFVLYMIRENGPCKVTALADQMEVKPSAITVMIDRLVKQGYVTREHDVIDRRSVLVDITENGREAVKQSEEQSNEIIGRYFENVSPEDAEQMIQTLEKLTAESPKRTYGRKQSDNE
jgi:MarR family transcriptional regulator, organic hydroperoxide resistance regulator